ncbi:MAG: aminotransferase class I/II-fold pyridoxal phosphate-dependent enzyme [Elusimicrobia bacterium]|nr:aminotransferase class I/II-fold pyridoxal phosphate-dependent enzyme [Elusimicrobiota bacterium]
MAMTASAAGALEWLKQVPREHGERVFAVDGQSGEATTYADLDRQSRHAAAALRRLGLRKGDRVAVTGDNSVAMARFYFGCLYAGIVAVPVNPGATDDEAAFFLQQSGAKALGFTAAVAARAGKWPAPRALELESFLAEADASSPDGVEPFEGVTDDDDLLLVYTSGTTASPKGVLHRYRDLVDNGRLFGRFVGLGAENRFYNILPMTYLGGYYNLLLLPYVCGSSVVIGEPFSAKTAFEFWKPVIRHQINTLWLVPSIISLILRMDRGEDGARWCRERVRLVLCGTAPLPLSVRRDFEKRYGVGLHENYGLTETLFLTANAPKLGVVDGSVGRLLEGVELRLVGPDGADAPPGADGEIVVRTPYLMRACQHTDEGRVAPHAPKDWFATGDIGVYRDGRLSITGRKKDLIIRGGVNIAPASIEELLYTNPAVQECAVVGVPNALTGEDIVAVVKLAPDAQFEIAKNELSTLCAKKLSKAKQPSEFVELPDLPRTASGKLQKHKIRAWLQTREARQPARPSAPAPALPPSFLKPSRVVSDIVQAMSIKYNTYVYEMRQRNEDVIVLSLGEAFFDIPLLSFDELPMPSGYHYSHSRGIPELRAKLAEYFLSEYDVSVDPQKEIILTAGSKIAIYMAMLAIINPNDEVMIHEPAWVSYAEQVKLCHGEPLMIPHGVSVFDFERYVTNRTRLIIINSPNNPSGKIYTLEELSHLNQLARKHGLYVLSDEAYSDFLLDPKQFISMGNLDPKKSHSLIVNSISKNFGISGWRLGYVISNPAIIDQILKLNQHLITCAPTILQHYIARNFDQVIQVTKPQIKDLLLRRRELAAHMDQLGLKYLAGDATFYFFVSIGASKLDCEAFCDELLFKRHVSTVPGIGYGPSCGRFIRVSVGAEPVERIQRGLREIADLIRRTT